MRRTYPHADGQRDDAFSSNRTTVIKIYLSLRILFIITSVGLLSLFAADILHLSGLPGEQAPWGALALFSGWSMLLFGVSLKAARSSRLDIVDGLIFCSLLPDGLAIYLAAEATGGSESPLYHSAYFLIAIHSYHLAVPEDPASAQDRVARTWRYFVIGALPSVLIAFSVYLFLDRGGWQSLRTWVELGLQLVMATSFAWLGLKDSERSRDLLNNEDQLETARRTLETAQSYQERLLQALGRVTNIAEMQDKKSLASGLQVLAEQIGQTFEVEYCAVGLADESTVEDAAVWTSFLASDRAKKLLEMVRINPIEGSLIGSVLLERRKPLIWDFITDGDILDPENPKLLKEGLRMNVEAAAGYREILPSGSVSHLLLIPFYAPQEAQRPVGYLHLINRHALGNKLSALGFETAHAKSLEAIAGQLAIAIENFRSHRREQEDYEDETFLDTMATSVKERDAFGDILSRLNQKLDSRVASLWLPIEDGFGPPEEIRKLVLRTVRVSGSESEPGENKRLERQLGQLGLQRHRDSYIGRFLDDGQNLLGPHYEPDISQHPHCWSELLEKIGSPRLLLLPIQDPLAMPNESNSPAEKVLAALCLRPRSADFQPTPIVTERLRRFARHIESLILEKRLRRRFRQIRLLKEGLERLQVEDLSRFYPLVVTLVRDVMGAEACTLFLRDRSPTQLVLKASTAQRANVETESGEVKEVAVADLIDLPIYSTEDRSLTVEAFRQPKPVLVYDSLKDDLLSRNFLEITKTMSSRSFLAAPIVSQGERLGVIHCINQQEPLRLLPTFLRSDLEFFVLLAGVVTRFIKSAESEEARRKFLRELTHELATPILQAQTNTSFIERYLRGGQRTRNPLDIVTNLRETLAHLQTQVRDIQLQLLRPGPQLEALYRVVGPVDIHGLVEQVRKPTLPLARESRAIEIFGQTSGMPALYVDRARMEQVLYNLLQNAVKYSRFGGPPIWVRYAPHKEHVAGRVNREWHRIRIENSGIGVPAGEEDLVFQEYVRGSNTQFVETGQSGTGQGLPVARRIVEHHGGVLRLERNDNPTIFAVLLPRSLERKASER